MHIKKKKIISFFIACILFFFCNSCGASKEILLEHSEEEIIEAQVSETDTEVEMTEDTVQEDLTEDAQNNQQIYVYICGQVKNPGVYQVSAADRVFSLIQLAGGLTEQADETGVNQAQTMTDGQMIYVPASGENGERIAELETTDSKDAGKININTANLETLMSLPGIGEGKAQSILNYRQEHGSFQSVEEIMKVDGIKEGTYTKFKDKITI